MKFHGGKQCIVINGNTYIDAADKKGRSLLKKIIRQELKGMLKKSAHDLESLLGEFKKSRSLVRSPL